MEREALKLALDVLVEMSPSGPTGSDIWQKQMSAITTISAVLAQPAQEPVAHLWECLGRWSAYLVENGKQADCAPPSWLVEAINKATTSPLPVQEPIGSLSVRYFRGSKAMTNTDFDYTGDLPEGDYELYTAPPQRTWIWLSDADIAEVVDTTCQYTGSYEEFLIKKAERKIRSMNNGT